jgi:hypothetical protein
VPFHFPSPEHPEDDCPHWWELGSSYPCRRCGIALLQLEPCPWRGSCYHCHLVEERQRKEALLSPEERAGPRCHVCGRPAESNVRSHPRCSRCIQEYEDYACSSCGGWTMILRTEPRTERCGGCELIRRLGGLDADQREAIRNAAQEGLFEAIHVAGELLNCGPSEARFAVQLLVEGSA